MKRVIAFSLWGSDPKYTVGAIKNADLARDIYPEWICRFYVGKSTPDDIIDSLVQKKNTEVFIMNEGGDWTGMFWRFYPASDFDVMIMISRDTDSRLNRREKAAVDEWLESDKGFHIMRDHPFHAFPVLGGMWGAKRGCLPRMKQLIEEWDQQDAYGTDYDFFANAVVPLLQNNVMVHDEFFREEHPLVAFQGCHPADFPIQRKGLEFVGEVYDHNEQTVPEHSDALGNFLKQAGTIK